MVKTPFKQKGNIGSSPFISSEQYILHFEVLLIVQSNIANIKFIIHLSSNG